MAQNDWYYACDGEQTGPVSAAELRQAADAGRITPDDLVWQEGMREWIPARKVKGLFEPRPPAAATPTAGATPPVAPVPLAPPIVQSEAAAPFERSAIAYQRSREGGLWHPLDGLLAMLRRQFSAAFAVGAAQLFGRLGFYGLYAAAVAAMAFGGALTLETKSARPVVVGAVWAGLLIVWQYSAGRFLTAGERLVRSGPARLASSALLDCCALGAMAAALSLLVYYSLLAVQQQWAPLLLPGVALFIVGQHLAILSLNPEALGLTITSEASTAEEALGAAAFVAKAGLRAAPVAFGAAVIWLTVKLLIAAVVFLLWPSHLYPRIVAGALGLLPFESAANDSWLIVLFLLTPLWTYLGYLFHHLAAGLVRSLLSVPGKLEQFGGDKARMKDEG